MTDEQYIECLLCFMIHGALHYASGLPCSRDRSRPGPHDKQLIRRQLKLYRSGSDERALHFNGTSEDYLRRMKELIDDGR
jgi:hypothetical protein